jgi:ribose 5-phosphate isomerase B
VAQAVARGDADRGLLICSNGIGMAIAANKVDGVRAALVTDLAGAEQSRRHNDANVLCLGGEMHSDREIDTIVMKWVDTPFEGGRHERRVRKIAAIEAGRDPATIDAEQANA